MEEQKIWIYEMKVLSDDIICGLMWISALASDAFQKPEGEFCLSPAALEG